MEHSSRNRPPRTDTTSTLLLAGMALGVLLALAGLAGAAGMAMEFAWRATPRMAWVGGQAVRALSGLIARGGLPMVLGACALVLGATMLAVICRQRGLLRRG